MSAAARGPTEQHEKWLEQARKDLLAADALVAAQHFEWACFVALQAAEKALKACLEAMDIGSSSRGAEGHNLEKPLEVFSVDDAETSVVNAKRLVEYFTAFISEKLPRLEQVMKPPAVQPS